MYNKLKFKKIGPCIILRNFGKNSYELELLEDMGISPIFKITDMYLYREDGTEGVYDERKIQWEKLMVVDDNLQMEKIIDQRLVRRLEERGILNTW